MSKFLNLTGLARFWSKVKEYVDNAVSTAKTSVGNYTVNGKKISTNPTLSKGDVGLSNVTNDAQVKRSEMGVANGVATLNEEGLVPSSQLPSFVDDVLEFNTMKALSGSAQTSTTAKPTSITYNSATKTFVASDSLVSSGSASDYFSNWAETTDIPAAENYGTASNEGRIPVSGKIYVDASTNKTYRWSGSALVEISASLALGETSSTAYRGDRGAAAYKHAVTNKGAAFGPGLYKITTNSEGHVTAATAVDKTDITALGIPGSNTTYSIATASTAGLVKPISVITKPTVNSATTTSGRYYPVQMSSDGNMFVNVPWTDNNTTYGNATSSAAGIVKLGSDTVQTVAANSVTATSGRTYAVQKNSNGQLVVNVPWTDTVDQAISDGEIDALFA